MTSIGDDQDTFQHLYKFFEGLFLSCDVLGISFVSPLAQYISGD